MIGTSLGLIVGGCASDAPTWTAIDAANVTDPGPNAAAYAKAVAAKDALATRLAGALGEAIGTPLDQVEGRSKGPAGAIDVCRSLAPQIAAEVAEEHHVRIGRAGVRLRNPRNAPPAWAAALLATHPTTMQAAKREDGTLGVILPIRLGSMCTACHGPRDGIAPDVQAALAKHYPDDQATGFNEGDLRGWFWVEVPQGR